MYRIRKEINHGMNVYYVQFEKTDHTFAKLMAEKKVLNKEKLGCVSVQYSERNDSFRVVCIPGTDDTVITEKIKRLLECGNSFLSSCGPSFDARLVDLLAGISKKNGGKR